MILEGLEPPTWSQVRRAACSARRVKPYCIFFCIKVLHALEEARRKFNRVQTWACWGHVGTMLAHFSLLGVFFSLWNASRTFVGRFFTHVRLFFRVLGGSGSDVWASRDNFEGPKLLFWVFCRPSAQVCNAKKLRMCKNHSFSCVFVWFLHIASFVFKPQNNAKSFPGPVQQSFLQRLCSHSVLKWILEGFGALWGVT